VRSPRANFFAGRFAGTLRRECPDHVLIPGERHLRRVLAEYVGTATATVRTRGYSRNPHCQPGRTVDITARIERRQVLGGLVSECRTAAQRA
jgi:hypothetical protein